jgi:hypothetical protein
VARKSTVVGETDAAGDEGAPVGEDGESAQAKSDSLASDGLAADDCDESGPVGAPTAPTVPASTEKCVVDILGCQPVRPELVSAEVVSEVLEAEGKRDCTREVLAAVVTDDLIARLSAHDLAALVAYLSEDETLFDGWLHLRTSAAMSCALRDALQVWAPANEIARKVLSAIYNGFGHSRGLEEVLSLAEGRALVSPAVQALKGAVSVGDMALLVDRMAASEGLAGLNVSSALINAVYHNDSEEAEREVTLSYVQGTVGRLGSAFWQEGADLADVEHMSWRRYRTALLVESDLFPDVNMLSSVESLLACEPWAIRAHATWVLANLIEGLDGQDKQACVDSLIGVAYDKNPNVAFEAIDKVVELDPNWRLSLQDLAANHPMEMVRKHARRALEQ